MWLDYGMIIIFIALIVRLIMNHINKTTYIKAEFNGAYKNTYINLYDLQSKDILPRVIIIDEKGIVSKELRINKVYLKTTYHCNKYKYKYLSF